MGPSKRAVVQSGFSLSCLMNVSFLLSAMVADITQEAALILGDLAS
jgi:hypothetical protein